MLMKRLPLARNFLAFSLLILTALLSVSCASRSDSPNAENPDTTFRASETRQNTQLPPSTNQNSTIATKETSPTFSEGTTPANKAPAISAGGRHSCALRQNGTISCWGWNISGQLGNRTETDSEVPVEVMDITDAIAISTGLSHSCALHQTGTISCWGNNIYSQLGRGTDNNSPVPAEVLGITDATAITSGAKDNCALHQDGTISCWGDNYDGTDSDVSVEIVGITDATAITAGWGHSCALHENGKISCWGDNYNGALGSRTETYSEVPVEVVDITDATAITAGTAHTCALHQDGAISCWGNNYSGQLGNITTTLSSVPVQVVGITDATAITAGSAHTCALHQDGKISCWGNNIWGQLGNRTDTWRSSVPVEVADITDATAITAGGEITPDGHTCALHQDGKISCWGSNKEGQLGNGTDDDSSVPVGVADIKDATAITAGDLHSCALNERGDIFCWGENEYGQLGNRTDTWRSSLPVEVADITDATAITTGGRIHSEVVISKGHSCALHKGGTISCWGNNSEGQLGNRTETDNWMPMEIVGITDATAITTGGGHTCALHQDGKISCWGNNDYGQLGNRTDTDYWTPMEIVGITDATTISAGGGYTCALHKGGTISCWGNNDYGQLGYETETWWSSVPVEVVDITDATAIATGMEHACALHQDGKISCWGSNYYGQLGNGTETWWSSVPVEVVGITNATAITAGYAAHSCALHQDGTISCWGLNQNGQLGNGKKELMLTLRSLWKL